MLEDRFIQASNRSRDHALNVGDVKHFQKPLDCAIVDEGKDNCIWLEEFFTFPGASSTRVGVAILADFPALSLVSQWPVRVIMMSFADEPSLLKAQKRLRAD